MYNQRYILKIIIVCLSFNAGKIYLENLFW